MYFHNRRPAGKQSLFSHLDPRALALSLLDSAVVEVNVMNFQEKAAARFSYARVLRCMGQSLDALELKAFELKCQAGIYLIQGWRKGTASSVDLELRYTADDIRNLESEGRKKRQGLSRKASLLNLSQLLRAAGNYVDHAEGRLLRVSWQNQSDKIQSITVQYETGECDRKGNELPVSTIDEICVHIYKQRKKIPGTSEKRDEPVK